MPCIPETLRHRHPGLIQGGILLGLILVSLPLGINFCYGNLSIYTDSYFMSLVGSDSYQGGSMWFMTIFMISRKLAMIIAGPVANKIGPHPTMIVCCICFTASVCVTYFSVQVSLWAMLSTLAALAGIFSGALLGMAYLHAATYFPHNVSVAMSVVTASFAIGALVLNPIITVYINPENKAPDIYKETGTYYSDKDILSKVPNVFLLLAGIVCCWQLVGMVVIKLTTKAYTRKTTEQATLEVNSPPKNANCASSREFNEKDSIFRREPESAHHETAPEEKQTQSNETMNTDKPGGTSTLQMLKSPLFYQLSFTAVPCTVVYNVVNNYYKQFGITYINDDYFLTVVGVLITVVVIITRVAWGFIIDAIGPQMSYVLACGTTSILYSFWFFTPMASKWLYMIWVLLIQTAQNSMLLLLPLHILQYFGKSHYVANLGVASVTSIIFILLIPLVIDTILNSYGYFWMFIFVAVCHFVSCCSACYLPYANLTKREASHS